MTTQTILLRFTDLRRAGIVRNRATLSRWIKKYGFPPGLLIGPNTRVWTQEELDQWLDERRRATAAATVVLLMVIYALPFVRLAA